MECANLLQYSELLKVHIFLWKQKERNPFLFHPSYIYVTSNPITPYINFPHSGHKYSALIPNNSKSWSPT